MNEKTKLVLTIAGYVAQGMLAVMVFVFIMLLALYCARGIAA